MARLMYNVNLPPVWVYSVAQQDALGNSWRELIIPVPDAVVVSINPTTADWPPVNGSGSFFVTITNCSGTWTATKDASADWVTIVSPTTPQSTNGTVNYSVVSNAGPARAANIYVNGKPFAITQQAGA